MPAEVENAFYPNMRVDEAGYKEKAAELSFGSRKKFSIVCALQHDPKVLIPDGPSLQKRSRGFTFLSSTLPSRPYTVQKVPRLRVSR